MNSNVWLIAFCSAASFCVVPLVIFVGGFLGADLAPNADLATIPIATMVIGTAVGTLPVSLLMGYIGRKPTYVMSILLGMLSCWLASVALVNRSFELFCVSSTLIGISNAAIQQLRFAAMESVAPEKGPTAVSVVLCSGVVGAFVGPELAVQGQFLSSVAYQGSFWLIAGCYLLSLLFLMGIKLKGHQTETQQGQGRPWLHILSNPAFCLAVASATIAYTIMTFVMTATPISMHHHHGHSLADTKWVIQSHIAAMFLPSLIGPVLLRVLSIKGLMVAGLGIYILTIGLGFWDTSVSGFWYQLVLLGIGWNFLFLAGTSLLPSTYQEGEQFKARGFNDGFVFSAQALASLSAGWVINTTSWQNLLLLCLGPIAVLILVLLWSKQRVRSL